MRALERCAPRARARARPPKARRGRSGMTPRPRRVVSLSRALQVPLERRARAAARGARVGAARRVPAALGTLAAHRRARRGGRRDAPARVDRGDGDARRAHRRVRRAGPSGLSGVALRFPVLLSPAGTTRPSSPTPPSRSRCLARARAARASARVPENSPATPLANPPLHTSRRSRARRSSSLACRSRRTSTRRSRTSSARRRTASSRRSRTRASEARRNNSPKRRPFREAQPAIGAICAAARW